MVMAEHFYDPANENLDREFKGNLSITPVIPAFNCSSIAVQINLNARGVTLISLGFWDDIRPF